MLRIEKGKKMKLLITCLLIITSAASFAQFDNPSNNSAQFEKTETDVASPTGLEFLAIKKPSLTNPDNRFNGKDYSDLGNPDKKQLDMSGDDGLLENKTNKAPKYFTKDKEAKDEYGRDQYLGDFKTTASYVNIVYRDHEYVDGDRIRVFVNNDIVQSSITLDSSFRGFDLTLEPGFNKIDFQALNQGESGPNTAELHVYDDKGQLVSAHEWNLLTGNKATVIIVKE